jgi:hypothetical protein
VFSHLITVQWSESDGAYVARVSAVSAEANGETPEAAVRAVLIAAGAETDVLAESAAASLGRAGGLKGGAARAASLSKKKRAEIAKKAAAARWASRDRKPAT